MITFPVVLRFVLLPLYCVEFILIGVQVLWYRKAMPDPVFSQFDFSSNGTKTVPRSTYLLVYMLLHVVLLAINSVAFQMRAKLVLRTPHGSFFLHSTGENESVALRVAGECVVVNALVLHLLFSLYYELAFQWNVRPHKLMPLNWLILLLMLTSVVATHLAIRRRLKARADPQQVAEWAHRVGHEVYIPDGSFVITEPGPDGQHRPASAGEGAPIAQFATRDARPVVVMVVQPGEGMQMGTSVAPTRLIEREQEQAAQQQQQQERPVTERQVDLEM